MAESQQKSLETSAQDKKSLRDGWEFPTEVSREIATIVAPNSEAAKAMRSIASQVHHLHFNAGVRTCCFISDERGAGTTVISANVAAVLAASGRRTLLVETNFHTPRLASLFGLDAKKPGLSDWLAGIGDTRIWSGYMQPAVPNLLVMTAGQSIEQGRDLLSAHFRFGVTDLARMFDIVICDAAPASDVPATLAVVSAVERVYVVARANRTKLKNILALQETVQQCGGAMGGTVYFDP